MAAVRDAVRLLAQAVLVASGLGGCAGAPEGLRVTPDGNGPTVVVDWDAEPLPEIPYPNDLATRVDLSSVTGLRLNISELAVTEREAHAREKLNELVGFGIYSPITVAFDRPLDLDEVLARHPNDLHLDETFDDDAIYVICVDPDSPDYLQPVALDIGHGRFPMDVPDPARYFPNDSRAEVPSLLFDTVAEDVNGNGRLDPGEDTDNDGILDVPNVHPVGGDPRQDLLTWYERTTNTLIVRPVVPLREETRYAVVLTERLVGPSGEPVRSPWEYVNHTRQTEALRPALEALAPWDLGASDVAYAWVFTTGRVTGDLVDIHRGLVDAKGPWPFLASDYPARIDEAHQLHERPELLDQYRLPIGIFADLMADLGLLGEEELDALLGLYAAFSGEIVGGSFVTPYLLADRDDGGRDDSDDWWQLDPVAGTLHAEPQRIAFTCLLPRSDLGFSPPYSVAFYGHGYGSSRIEGLGFAHAMNRVGLAACLMDFPGHGPTASEEEWLLIEALLDAEQMAPFLAHVRDSRSRDLDNDGIEDSGGDQWSADAFHTRDMVRQASVDWMQVIRAMKQCGTEGEMERVELSTGDKVPTGEYLTSCDWDDDGVPDLGGPDAEFFIVGGSLGGINSAVAAAVIPEVTAWVPVVGGGGTLDIGVRTEIGGAVEALVGRLLTPMFLGYPTDDGGLQIVQMVTSVTDMRELHVATLDAVPAGGTFVVENLHSGEVREGIIPADGRFRVSIPADAMDAAEKRLETGIPETGPSAIEIYSSPDNAFLGDPFAIEVYDATGALVAQIDTWEEDVVHEGVTMFAGSPLIAGSHGTGHIRGTPEARRLATVLAAVLEPGDAISYARHYYQEPFEVLGGEPTNVLLMPTVGDTIVSVNTQIAQARAAGLVDWQRVDPRYGTTVDQFLIDTEVIRGLEEFGPWTNDQGEPVLFDADNLDGGKDGFGAPSDVPLRAVVHTSAGVSGLRMPYVSPRGTHGFAAPDPTLPFDINLFAINQVAWFFGTSGQEISDDPCLARGDCDFFVPFPGDP